MKPGSHAVAAATVDIPASRSSFTIRSCNVPNARSIRPLACGLLAQIMSMFSANSERPNCVTPSPPAAAGGVQGRQEPILFPSRFREQPHLSTRQYARIVHRWVERAGLDSSAYGTHSMRRTKGAQIYKKKGNWGGVQLRSG